MLFLYCLLLLKVHSGRRQARIPPPDSHVLRRGPVHAATPRKKPRQAARPTPGDREQTQQLTSARRMRQMSRLLVRRRLLSLRQM